MRPLLIGLLALLLLPAAAAAETRSPIAALPNESPVREYAGTALLSRYDASARAYRLVVVDGRGAQRVLPVAPARGPFDADIGPGADGEPLVVLSTCVGDDRVAEPDCDLQMLRLDGSGPTPIAAANTPERTEYAPTVWRGRIAFARSHTQPVVYTRPLDAPRSMRSRRLPGVPTRRCSELVDRPRTPAACRTTRRNVQELELRGSLLALDVGYVVRDQAGHGTDEVRLDDLRTGSARRVAKLSFGEGGQDWLGLSFAGGRLGWTKSCFGDPGGCSTHGPYRYDPRDDTYQAAEGPYRALAGFALTAAGSLQLDGRSELGDGPQEVAPGPCTDPRGGGRGPNACPLERVTGMRWRAVARRRMR